MFLPHQVAALDRLVETTNRMSLLQYTTDILTKAVKTATEEGLIDSKNKTELLKILAEKYLGGELK